MTFSYEDFEVGAVAQLGGHTFLKEEIIEFAGRYDPQPFHLSEAGGEASPFRGLVASGWNTCSAMMGILVRDMLSDSTSMGSPGLDNIRWLKPVRAGDTLSVRVTVLKTAPSKSKPDRGAVTSFVEVINQAGEIVMTGHEFYDFEAKYLDATGADVVCPTNLTDAELASIRDLAARAFDAIGGSGLARADFFLTETGFVINELNTMPGFTPISMFPKCWLASGMSYPELIDELITLGLETAR